jgi:hypothetical protein
MPIDDRERRELQQLFSDPQSRHRRDKPNSYDAIANRSTGIPGRKKE